MDRRQRGQLAAPEGSLAHACHFISNCWVSVGGGAWLLVVGVCFRYSFVGADVGGFFGHPEEELFTRWHQLSAATNPFYR